LADDEGQLSWGIFFYSTYFTSVWVWLYVLSGFVVILGRYLGLGFGFLKRIFDIDNKPIRSLGYVSILLVTVVYLVAAPFVLT
jgi:hypothetical protein